MAEITEEKARQMIEEAVYAALEAGLSEDAVREEADYAIESYEASA